MGVSSGAATATTTSSRMRLAPMITYGLRRSRRKVALPTPRAGSGIADPRVQERVAEVDQQVDQGEDGGQHQHRALHDEQLAGADGVDDQHAYPGPGEDRLHHHGPAQQRTELHA